MSALTHLWLLRHGHIVLPAQKSFIGQSNLPLSARGRQQIQSWKPFFASKNITAVLCSQLDRCQESAALLCPVDTPIITEKAFNEIHLGTWEGQSIASIRAAYPQDYALRGTHLDSFRPPQGESFHDLTQRVLPALRTIISTYKGKNIVLVAHAGVNRVILSHYMHMPLTQVLNVPQPYACCTHLALSHEF